MAWENLKALLPQDTLTKFLNANEINVLVSGITGVGKSSLVNALLGVKIAKEGDDLNRETTEVTMYHTTKNGVRIIVWDSPGLQDDTDSDDAYIADMKAKCSSVDLVLFCSSFVATRFPQSGDKTAAKMFTNAYTDEVWNKAVFVLTRVNEFLESKKKAPQVEVILSQFKTLVPDMLIKCGVSADVAKKVPIVPVGYIDVDGECAGRKLPPICDDWLESLWYNSVLRMRFGGQVAMVKYSMDRLKKDENITPSNLKASPEHQPIGVSAAKVAKYGLPPTVTTILGGIIGFFVAGPVGAAAGVAAGAAMGAAVDGVVYRTT